MEQKQGPAKQEQVRKEMKRWLDKMKAAQAQINTLVKDNWVDEARRFAERQGKEVRKLIQSDLNKVRTFVERERKDLEKLQSQIPAELDRWKKALETQKKELSGLLNRVGVGKARPKKSARKARVKGKPKAKATRGKASV
jgi:ABC-type transporter Mla subunit MlaD